MSDQDALLSLVAEPPGALLYFGADPGWSPARENRPAPRKAGKRKPQPVPSVCPTCGGQPQGGGPDRLCAYETVDNVCATCMRSHYDGAHRGRTHEADPARPGRSASRVTGKTDPALNPYEKARMDAKAAALKASKEA